MMIPGAISIKRGILDLGTTPMIPEPSPRNIIKTINTIKIPNSTLGTKIIDKDLETTTMSVEMIGAKTIGIVETIEMTEKEETIVEIEIAERIKSILISKFLNMSKKF